MRPVIQSEKHIVQITLSEAMATNAENTNLVNVVDTPGDVSGPADVIRGTTVKAVYIELWVLATSQQPATVIVEVEKTIAGQGPPTFAIIQDTNGYGNKKNIFEFHQGIIGDANANPTPFFRHWVKIPKGKQRFGSGDKLRLIVSAITENTQFCGMAIFKAYN